MFSKDFVRNFIVIIICTLFIGVVSIINNSVSDDYPNALSASYEVNSLASSGDCVDFLQDDTIIYRDENLNSDLFNDCYYVLLVNETDREVLAAKNVHQRMYPASMTKMMTAIVVTDAVEAGEINLEDVVTVSEYYDLTSHDVAPCQLFPGYQITVKDLLYGLMIESNNYYALMLAKYISGDTESFCKRMNEKAKSIGATNTHFMNPHGLDDPEHYSTGYDMYLIIKEAHNHDILRDIDKYDTYSYTYKGADGAEYSAESTASNMFITGEATLPATFTIETWKTGTTNGAGNCLAMYVTREGKTYVVIASSGESRESLYDAIIKLLCLIK